MSVNMEVQEKDVNVTEAPPVGPPPADVVNQAQTAETPRQRLVDVKVVDENVALNIMVGFLNMAQRRGSFNFEESAKIAECIRVFTRPGPATDNTVAPSV
tara:strand:+ start:1376 stop:1675 length:300 start_codon:yes stop_codon:yes gene_type:complete